MRTFNATTQRRFYWQWAVIAGLFAAVGWTQLTRFSFWHDEIYTLSFLHGVDAYLFAGSDLQATAQHPLAWYQQLLRQDLYWQHFWRDIVHEGHPPLYFLLLKGWTLCWGTDERGLRSFSLLAAILTLLAAGRVGALFSHRAAVLLPLLLAGCPPFLYFALEARMYALYLLLAVLTCYWMLRALRPASSRAAVEAGWFAGVGICLVYTHYYGLFWYGTLALVLAVGYVQRRAWGKLLVLALPGLALLPWLPIIRQQTAAHHEHWTNGYLGWLASAKHYVHGGMTLLIAQAPTYPELLVLAALLLALGLTLRPPLAARLTQWGVPAALLLVYGAVIIAFDFALNHHTIAVPRYYLPLQFALLLSVVLLGEQSRSRLVEGVLLAGLLLFFGKTQVALFTTPREAKQMYRAVGRYLAQRYPANSVELVVSPNGPTTLGIAYYCPVSYPVRAEPAGQVCREYAKPGVVVVEQHLGLPIEPWAQPCPAPPAESRFVRFVAVDIVNAR